MGQCEWGRHRQRLQARSPLAQREVDQHLVINLEHIPGDVDHRHRGHQRVIRRHPTQPRLQRVEGHHPAVVKREDLAVEHHIGMEAHGSVGDLRELRGYVLEVAAVERGIAASAVQLAPDSVIFVFNPDILPESRHGLRCVGDRRREHGAQRHEPARCRVVETSGTSETRCLTEIAGEHHRAAHRCGLRAERHRDRLLNQAFAQPDAQLGSDQLGDVSSFIRARPADERTEQIGALARDSRARDLGKCRVEVTDRDRRCLAAFEAGEQVAGHIARV